MYFTINSHSVRVKVDKDAFFRNNKSNNDSTKCTMPRTCLVTQRCGMAGQRVSHANNKSKRRFLLNLQQFCLRSDILDQNFNIRLSTRGLRTIEFHGGLDGYVNTTKNSKLDPYFKKIKKRIAAKSA